MITASWPHRPANTGSTQPNATAGNPPISGPGKPVPPIGGSHYPPHPQPAQAGRGWQTLTQGGTFLFRSTPGHFYSGLTPVNPYSLAPRPPVPYSPDPPLHQGERGRRRPWQPRSIIVSSPLWMVLSRGPELGGVMLRSSAPSRPSLGRDGNSPPRRAVRLRHGHAHALRRGQLRPDPRAVMVIVALPAATAVIVTFDPDTETLATPVFDDLAV